MTTYSRIALTFLALIFTLPAVAEPDLAVFPLPIGAGFAANPSSADPADTVTVSGWRIRNVGYSNAPASAAGIFLSTDEDITREDRSIGTTSIPAMQASSIGGLQSVAVTIPDDMEPRQYYIGVIADVGDEVTESDETNNTLTSNRMFTVRKPILADLVPVSEFWNPLHIATGHPSNISYFRPAEVAREGKIFFNKVSVRNAGVESTPGFNVGYYFSSDDTWSYDDRFLGSVRQDGVNAKSTTTYSDERAYFVPETAPTGDYYLIVWVDKDNEVAERWGGPGVAETNNTLALALKVLDVPSDSTPISRVQIRLKTANVRNANTNDPIAVSLNDDNQTWVDYCRNDFERKDNEGFDYDLVLDEESTLGDIDQIKIGKTGTNGWCLKGFDVFVNDFLTRNRMIPVFSREYSSCQWIDPPGANWIELASYAELRNAEAWNKTYLPSESIGGDAIKSIIEANVGHMNHEERTYWKSGSDGDCVRLEKVDDATINVGVALKLDVPLAKDPTIVTSFDFRVSCSCGVISMEADNIDVHAGPPLVEAYFYNLARVLGSALAACPFPACSIVSVPSVSSTPDELEDSIVSPLGYCPRYNFTDYPSLRMWDDGPEPTLVSTSFGKTTIRPEESHTIETTVQNKGNTETTFTTVRYLVLRKGPDQKTILDAEEYDAISDQGVTVSTSSEIQTVAPCTEDLRWDEEILIPDGLVCTVLRGGRLPRDHGTYHLVTRIRPDNNIENSTDVSVHLVDVECTLGDPTPMQIPLTIE